MPFINWENSFSVGLDTFDNEHKQLVEIVNKLHMGLISGLKQAALNETLDGLEKYTSTHFKHEEKLMQEHGYPSYAEHKKEHDQLIQKVAAFHNEFHEGKAGSALEVMAFLKDWLLKHIAGTDMQYSSFFKSKGVK